jgi:hypothetical protein
MSKSFGRTTDDEPQTGQASNCIIMMMIIMLM